MTGFVLSHQLGIVAAAIALAVAGFVLHVLDVKRTERRYEIQMEALRGRAWRETGRRHLAEARVWELLGEGGTALDDWEQEQFDGITERLRVDVGPEIFGDEGGAA